MYLQGDPNQNLKFLLDNSENMHFRPNVGKAKICTFWMHPFILKIVNKRLKNYKQTAENQNKWTPLKHILALPTWGKKCIFSEL